MSIPPEVATMLSTWREMDGQRFSIYLFTFPWFGPAMEAAGYLSNQPDAQAIHAIEQRVHAEWTRLTGLRPLCDEDAWRDAAAALGYPATTSAWAELTCKALGDSIRAWAGAKAAESRLKEPAGKPAAPNAKIAERMAAVMDDEDARIMAIAGDDSKSVEDRMQVIVNLDNRAAGWPSTRWGKLLGASDAAVRKTNFWKQIKERQRLD